MATSKDHNVRPQDRRNWDVRTYGRPVPVAVLEVVIVTPKRQPGMLWAVALASIVWQAVMWLGRAYGSTRAERRAVLAGDDIVAEPSVVTDHSITIDAPPECVWPWLLQMGWHRGGWYTARWVDRLLFPANRPSAVRLVPEWQKIEVGSFIPDGAPETKCGFIVEHLEPERALVLHSTSHLPPSLRSGSARLDWSWAFVLTPLEDGTCTRFHFRSRWTTAPLWFTVATALTIVPADFVMSRSMLRGVRVRAEQLALGSKNP